MKLIVYIRDEDREKLVLKGSPEACVEKKRALERVYLPPKHVYYLRDDNYVIPRRGRRLDGETVYAQPWWLDFDFLNAVGLRWLGKAYSSPQALSNAVIARQGG
jgi:hypothetical protein